MKSYPSDFKPKTFMSTNPILIEGRLAVYTLGQGKPILLMPCPHAQITCPSAYNELATCMLNLGRQVLTFDSLSSFASPGPASCKLYEMIESAQIARDTIRLSAPIDVIGHSMATIVLLRGSSSTTRKLIVSSWLANFLDSP